MKIIKVMSHMGGTEFIKSNHPERWTEIEQAIQSVDPASMKTKVSKEIKHTGKLLYSPKTMNNAINESLRLAGWKPMTEDTQMLERVEGSRGSRRVIDFAKDGIAIEVQFGKYAFIAYDFVKFLTFYEEQRINVGVEIMAMRSLTKEMSSGVGSWESAMQVLKTRPRGHPPMPLVLIGMGVN
ncbi:MAG: BglII/BstYI family type II restriction endonuclease [Gammaproteobacteria bacterium]|nr:BglII/BstYI family type II restriction endonuclease [Gammaproteobacteria bacterium]